jgi:hypothetical protein
VGVCVCVHATCVRARACACLARTHTRTLARNVRVYWYVKVRVHAISLHVKIIYKSWACSLHYSILSINRGQALPFVGSCVLSTFFVRHFDLSPPLPPPLCLSTGLSEPVMPQTPQTLQASTDLGISQPVANYLPEVTQVRGRK